VEEIRVRRDDWSEECKKIHRQGLSVKNMRTDGDDFIVTVAPRVEVRVEQPDTHGEAFRELGGDAA